MSLSTHYPTGSVEHLVGEEAVIKAREDFFKRRPRNLEHLFQKRYQWMNQYTEGKGLVVDLGAGLGMSREFIKNPNLLVTDITKYPWIDRQVDALAPPFDDQSVDVFICGHMIHHLGYPVKFFENVARMLTPGGYVLIQELETSLALRASLWLRGNEGWDRTVDVFDRDAKCTPLDDPWSANCAIPELLFSSSKKFESNVPAFSVIKNELCEFLIFPLSGGVLAKVPTIELPLSVLKAVDALDGVLVSLAPSVFALGRRVVLKKR